MLTVSGTGNFFLTWDNVSSQPIPANATAYQVGTFFAKREVRELEVVFKPVGWTPGRFFKKQIQTAIEELLAVKCKLEPLLANILLRLGFEQGTTPGLTDPDPLLHLCPLSFSLSLFVFPCKMETSFVSSLRALCQMKTWRLDSDTECPRKQLCAGEGLLVRESEKEKASLLSCQVEQS